MSYDLAAYKAALPMLDAYAEWKTANNSGLQYGRLYSFNSAGYRKLVKVSNEKWKLFRKQFVRFNKEKDDD